MKLPKFLLPFGFCLVSFFLLFLIYYYQIIHIYIFWLIVKYKPVLVLGSIGEFYLFGIFLLSILIGWKFAKSQNPKIKTFVIVFKLKVTQNFILIISILSIFISFNQLYFFTENKVYKTEFIPKMEILNLNYSDIESSMVLARFELVKGAGTPSLTTCQLYTNITILSKYFDIQQKSLNFRQIYILGPLLRSNGVNSTVNYINSCNFIPDEKRSIIEDGFGVKI